MSVPGSFPVDVPPFTESDLRTLKANRFSPTHPLMELMETLTLHKLSPIKLSPDQASSCSDFLAKPWPKKGEALDATYHDVLRAFNSMGSTIHWSGPTTIATSEGCMMVIGACYAAVVHRISGLSIASPDDTDNLIWAIDIDKTLPDWKNRLTGAVREELKLWYQSVIAWIQERNSETVSTTQPQETPTALDVAELASTLNWAAGIAQYRLTAASRPAGEASADSVTSVSRNSAASAGASWFSSWWPSHDTKPGPDSLSRASDNPEVQSAIFKANVAAPVDGKVISTRSLSAIGSLQLQAEMIAMTAKISEALRLKDESSSAETDGGPTVKGKGKANN